MNALIQFFIRRSFVVNLISAFVVLAGITFGSMLKRDLTPPFEFKMVSVSASLPGASPSEVEKHLAFPVEQALKGISGIKKITSTATAGSYRLWARFPADHKDMDLAVETIRSRVDQVRWLLPQDTRDFVIRQEKVDKVFQIMLGLKNFEEFNTEHRLLARKLQDQIAEIPGIVQTSSSMHPQNVFVYLRPKDLRRHEISVAEVRNSIAQGLAFAPVGKVDFEDQSFAIEVKRPAEDIETLKRLTLRSNRTGQVLRLDDVADVKVDINEIKNAYRIDGAPSLKFFVQKDVTADSIKMRESILAIVGQFNETLPKPLEVIPVIDGGQFIAQQLSSLKGNALFGFTLVLLILTLFFNFKVSLVTSFGVPIAYCGTLATLYFLGISIDLISVVGMILVLGILVDDAIIIAERYMENLEKGFAPKDAAVESAKDLMIPVTGTILTTVFAFSPMVLIPSEIALVFYAVPVVIITSLAMSWLESFFILPNHLFHFISKPIDHSKRTLFPKVKKTYTALLRKAMAWRYPLLVGLAGFMAASIWVATNKIQQNFNFNVSLERITVRVQLKKESSLKDTLKAIEPIEEYLSSLPKEDIEHVVTDAGTIWMRGRRYDGNYYGKISAYINKNHKHPEAIKKKYGSIIKKAVEEFRTDEMELLEVRTERRGDDERKKNMVTATFYGDESLSLKAIQEKAEVVLKKHPEYKLNLVRESKDYQTKWVFHPNLKTLAQHRLQPSDITRQLRSFFVPHELAQIRNHGETQWVYTQVKRDKRIDAKVLGQMTVLNSRGVAVPLRRLGDWKSSDELLKIQHTDGQRITALDFSFDPESGINIVQAMENSKKLAKKMVKENNRLSVKVENADEGEAERRAWALKVAVLCVILVLFTLALVLNSLTLPIIVGLPIPFGLMGIIWALYLHNLDMGMMALVGLIGTVGVSVNDSLIMVDQINKRGRVNGIIPRENIIDGAVSRLRAIMLTSITTIGGVFPMAYGIGGESGFTQPLAFSIGWGLFFSTFLTLFALPAFVEIRQDFSRLADKLRIQLLTPWLKKKTGDTASSSVGSPDGPTGPLSTPPIGTAVHSASVNKDISDDDGDEKPTNNIQENIDEPQGEDKITPNSDTPGIAAKSYQQWQDPKGQSPTDNAQL